MGVTKRTEKLPLKVIYERIEATEGFSIKTEGTTKRKLDVALPKKKSPGEMTVKEWLEKTFPGNSDEVKVLRPSGRIVKLGTLSSVREKYPENFIHEKKVEAKEKVKMANHCDEKEMQVQAATRRANADRKKKKEAESEVKKIVNKINHFMVDAESEAGAQALDRLLQTDHRYHDHVVRICTTQILASESWPTTIDLIDTMLQHWSAAIRLREKENGQ